MLFLIGQVQIEPSIVTVNYIEQGLEAPIVIEAAFVLRKHEKSAFANKKTCQVHRPIAVYRFARSIDTSRSPTCFAQWVICSRGIY